MKEQKDIEQAQYVGLCFPSCMANYPKLIKVELHGGLRKKNESKRLWLDPMRPKSKQHNNYEFLKSSAEPFPPSKNRNIDSRRCQPAWRSAWDN